MTKKKTKNEQIEELQERIKTLEKESAVRRYFKRMSRRDKELLALLLVLIVVSSLLLFTLAFTKASVVSPLTESDFNSIISMVNGREWKVSEKTLPILKEKFPSATGKAITEGEKRCLRLGIELNSNNYVYIPFYFHSTFISSHIFGVEGRLEYSETVLGNGKSLSLNIDEDKIIFREHK